MDSPPPYEPIVLEGAISIDAALRGESREITRIIMRQDKSEPAFSRIERAAEKLRIPVSRVDADSIDQAASGTSHGGIVAIAGPRRFSALAELAIAGPRWVAMIDGVEDPYNFGSAVRSLYAAGAAGLIVRPRNWFTAAGVVARASAGASELIPTAIAETVEEAATLFRANGYAVACADESPEASNLYETDLTRPLFILIGGEKRGVTRSFRDSADITLRIPYGTSSAHSLGTAAATAVIAFEILRQRNAGGESSQPSRPPARPAARPHRASLLNPHRGRPGGRR